jgi:hypothetical protein
MSSSRRLTSAVREARSKQSSTLLPASRGSGAPLPAAERAYFESRLGQDFSRVRVHTDEWAAGAAASLNAKAFCVGNELAFGNGRYRPGTPDGREILAHELTHVAQQNRGGGGTIAQAESRAEASAQQVSNGGSASAQNQGGAPQGLYCDPDDDKKNVASDDTLTRNRVVHIPPTAAGQSPFLAPMQLQLTDPQPTTLAPRASLFDPKYTPNPLLAPSPAQILPPYKLMVNADILAPFSLYGASPSRMGINIVDDWGLAYTRFNQWLPESLAATSTNMFLAAAYQAALARDNPSIFDKSDLEFKAAHPDEKRIPPIPVISSSTMTKLYEVISGKKDTNAFYF